MENFFIHGGVYEDYDLVICDIVQFGKQMETVRIKLPYLFSSIRLPQFITSYPIR